MPTCREPQVVPDLPSASKSPKGDPLLGRLLAFRKRQKKSVEELSRVLGVASRTLRRWECQGRIPPHKRAGVLASIRKLQGWRAQPKLEEHDQWGPQALLLGMRSAAKLAKKAAQRAQGYAAVWLMTELEEMKISPLALKFLRGEGADRAFVQLLGPSGLPARSVCFSVAGGRLHYQCLRHPSPTVSLPEIEGVADAEGFSFCREFLSRMERAEANGSQTLTAKLRKTINKHV